MPRITDKKVLFPELSYKICGFCFQVHNKLGRYRNEKQYADALGNLLTENKIEYIREKKLPASFTGEKSIRNIPDFVIDDKVVVDLKAKEIVTKEDYYQMRRYLVSSNKKLGLIINFRSKYLRPKRILSGVFESFE
ncbi:MAG: hypothetical protein A2174_02200 [Candidatus Portnoybacteria bacterium RBG_13_41_18]|uniref:GxxExxY protein n=1 Tax=Candidatus Portnoybacteria bacterium RBG_13_41_18 TaxID=1801991 RepID=A0A1G2F9I5_9BACT|nr:MAG: hypothetical protein A2174_02200 [Candidatus Portnoybacteria bacterium RBG_13_41_18]